MKKTKIKLLTVVTILTTAIGTTPAFAASNINTQTTTASSVSVNLPITDNNLFLEAKDLSSIKENINSILSSKYEIMKTGKSKDYSNIIGDSKLLELVNKTNDLDVNWFKNFTKIDTYTSNVTVMSSTKTSTNTYALNVLYDIKFKLHGMNTLSQSKNEKYRFEVKYIDGKWYITKMLDLNDEDNDTSSVESVQATTETNSVGFSNYDNSIGLQIKNIDEKSKSIEDNLKYFKVQQQINLKTQGLNTLSSDYQYSPNDAASYARTYAESPNPAYHYYDGDDCTNFVSQCVYAGGIPTNPGVWMPGQYDWNTVLGFYSYMTNYGYATGATWTNGARLGDVVQWYNPAREEWSHSLILTGSTDDDWLYCSHSNNRTDYPLYATYESSTFTNMRTIEFWH